MKLAIQFSNTGSPNEGAELVSIESENLRPEDVLLDVLITAINPSQHTGS